MKQIRIFPLLTVLIFTPAAIRQAITNRSCERASGTTFASAAGCPGG
jgi:hypothetical protein